MIALALAIDEGVPIIESYEALFCAFHYPRAIFASEYIPPVVESIFERAYRF